MSGPPKDLPASQLWLKLASTERPFKVVDFPRKDSKGEPIGQLAIRVLTQEEQMICTSAAEDVTRKHLKEAKKEDLGYERLFTDAVCVEMLYRACRDSDDPSRPAFPTPKNIREQLTTDECAKLFEHYLTVQLELGPLVTQMSEEELEAWIDRLVEGGSAVPLALLASDLQQILVLYMAYQLRSLPTDKSSATSPPEEIMPGDSEKIPETSE